MGERDDSIRDFAQRHGLSEQAAGEMAELLVSMSGERHTQETMAPLQSATWDPEAMGVKVVERPDATAEAGDQSEDTFATLDAPDSEAWEVSHANVSRNAALLQATSGGLALEQGDAPESARYEYLGQLGVGGMGEVRKVRDRELQRVVAMKVLKPKLMENERSLRRFQEEAQVAAQLQHPGIVPVHDIGRLADGRVFFTMKEVRGKTLDEVVRPVVEALKRGERETADGIGLRRVITLLQRVAETVAFAHHRGVVHRDLKPANIMLGDYGEVLVLDWGLAKVLHEERDEPDPEIERVHTSRSMDDSLRTRMGAISGTPRYMAPEQARGLVSRIGPSTDVWALGVMLYEVLCGQPLYRARTVRDLVDSLAAGDPFPPPSEVSPYPVDETLERIALLCLEERQRDRFDDAGPVSEALLAWLDGAAKRERALQVVEEGSGLLPEAKRLRARAQSLRERSAEMLSGLGKDAADREKGPAWDLEDEARAMEERADETERKALQLAQAALTHDPELAEAHELLAEAYHAKHAEAEAEGNTAAAAGFELYLRAHDRGRYVAYLKGDGAVTLVTEPAGAEVELFRFVEKRRRLVPEHMRSLGRTPLVKEALPMGSYLLKIRAPGHHEVNYPVLIGRQDHWHGIRPGETEPYPIVLPKLGELAEDECYVPAGWFWSGGELEQLDHPLPRRWMWADGFVVKKYPITNQEYLEFLNALVDLGEDATPLVPAMRGTGYRTGFNTNNEGRFELGPDSDGDPWDPLWPVVCVSPKQLEAYLGWLNRSGGSWRLLMEREWEKAARGVDSRTFPWGESAERHFVKHRGSPGLAGPARVDAFGADQSPFGIMGSAGNVRDVVASPYPGSAAIGDVVKIASMGDASHLVTKGGHWDAALFWCRADLRAVVRRDGCFSWNGSRLARSW